MNFRKLMAVVLVSCLCISLTGCKEKVTTLADDITANEKSEYIKMDEFELKGEGVERENIGYCAVMIPADFVEVEDIKGMYVSNLYPLDSSNIYYTAVDPATLGYISDNMDADSFKMAIEDAYRAVGDPIDLKVDSFSKESMEGIPCYKVRSHYAVEDDEIQQLVYIILANNTHIITYSQTSDDVLLADFETSEGELKLVRERSNA